LYLQKPLASVVAPTRRRPDVAWAVALLWGLVLYQQVNATSGYTAIDDKLNSWISFPHYPNPVAYLGLIGLFAAVTAAAAWGIGALSARRDVKLASAGQFMNRTSRFGRFFMPIAYGLIPVVGADYFARQLPKFFQHATRVIPAVQHIVGAGSARSPLYSVALLSDPRIITVQLVVIGLGTVGSLWSTWRIVNRELVPVSRNAISVRVAALSLVLACGMVAAWLYILINAAD
jgi:hypothetical protein